MLTHEQQGSEARLRVLAAAVEEFARHGFSGARIRSIVDAAHVNVAAVNYYFGGKEGLYRATLMSLAVRMDPLDAARMRAIQGGPEPLRAAVGQVLLRLATSQGPTPLARILAHEALAQANHLAQLLEETMAADLTLLESILRETGATGAADARGRAVDIVGRSVLYLHAAPAFDWAALDLLAAQVAEASKGAASPVSASPGGPE